jgi:HAD superfamily 5'-nucleotidase-like hydrolase
VTEAPDPPPPGRRVYCNRTLNLRSIRAIGFDMDYTLVHYRIGAWERCAFEHLRERVLGRGWPVGDLPFDPDLFTRGLIIDRELGNVVKANRFGYVKRACHGTRMLDFDGQRRAYGRTVVDLSDGRWAFLNTLFSLSEACMFGYLVDLHDASPLPGVSSYSYLYGEVRRMLDRAHIEGSLKADIVSDPDRYVESDADTARSLLDFKQAGRKLLLITNSDWPYTRAMMEHVIDPFLPGSRHWRDLFDTVLVMARKPDFFTSRMPLFEVVDEDRNLLTPCESGLRPGRLYAGGDAAAVEAAFGVSGEEVLYVGDHMFTDVHLSKSEMRWRTALILRELESEIAAIEAFRPRETRLAAEMEGKDRLEARLCAARLRHLRLDEEGGAPEADRALHGEIAGIRAAIVEADARISPLAQEATELLNRRWGLLLRAGNDKSHLARQIERYADVYTSRVSNFLPVTPFAYLRSPRGSLPHDGASAALPLEP